MKTKHKALLLTLCAVLLVAAGIFGTIAYFTDQDAATNTFTVGSVGLKLDEAKVSEDGTPVQPAERTEEGNKYHLLPGHTYTKDPTVTVDAKSGDAYVRLMVKVENLNQLMQAMPVEGYPTFYNGDLFLLQNLCVDEDGALTWDSTKWVFKEFHANGTYANCYEFRYYTTANGTSGTNSDGILDPLFTKITVPGEIDNDDLTKLANVEIVVTAHAIQATGFDTADAAWTAFDTQNS